MTKRELVLAVSGAADIPPKAVEMILNTTVETIIDAVASGDSITIPGFGTFFTKHRAARVCRNPKTGEPVKVDACEGAAYKPGKRLKEAVNGR